MSFKFHHLYFKNSSIVLLTILMIVACNLENKKPNSDTKSTESGIAKFVLLEESHNFGPLNAGEIVAYTFKFRNAGTKTLTITNFEVDCGCTDVKIPEKNIKPGQEGQIEVIYNSAGEVGKELKTITIFTNGEPTETKIYFRANVTNDLIELNS